MDGLAGWRVRRVGSAIRPSVDHVLSAVSTVVDGVCVDRLCVAAVVIL